MSTSEILWEWLVPLLLYSGPVLPLMAALVLPRASDGRSRRRRRGLFILFLIQVASFLPCIVAFLIRTPNAIHGLIWPALIGPVLFLWGLFYLGSECVQLLKPKHRTPIAEPRASPNGGPATQLGNSGVTEGPASVR